MAIDITERLLVEAAGRETVELARALLESGQVVSSAYLPPVLKGLVREGNLELRAGLKIRSPSDIENMCSCRVSREWGSICAHSVAVGLALLKKRAVWTVPGAPAAGPAKPASASAPIAGGRDNATAEVRGERSFAPPDARVDPGVAVAPPSSPVPEPGTFSLTLEGSLTHLSARLQRVYSKRVVTLGVTSPSENWALPDPNDPGRTWCRDRQSERLGLEELKRFGFAGPDTTGQFGLRSEEAILAFFGEGCPKLERQGWELSIGPRFRTATAAIERITPRVEITSSGEQWFELALDLAASGGERFSPAELQRLLQHGKNHVRLENGKLAVFNQSLLSEFNAVLGECGSQQLQLGRYRIHKAHAGFLETAVGEAGFGLKAPESWRSWARSQQGSVELAPLDLGDLEPVLRAYQKQGATWLRFLAAHGLGGILADDMGLGKTLQALAFLRSQPGPSLVVCPSSLVFNWRREAEKFTPERKVLSIEGANRAALFSRIPEADLVITSYPLLRRDAERYRRIAFSTVILDEAQHIKNPSTKNAQAAGILRASNRFILTGTPVENSLRDLWSLMGFVLPGYLGDRDTFRDRYEIPISRQDSLGGAVTATPASTRISSVAAPSKVRAKEALERLSKRLRPFLLRRRKQEVAADLPPKLEQVAYCELSEAQRQVYASLLSAARNQVTQAIAEKNQARMFMLTALLRLRQAACDLRLLNLEGGLCEAVSRTDPGKAASGKREMFHELLQEALDGGHRVLVFSQFVSMLALIRKDLEKAGIDYCYLDGQTKERAAEVDRFQGSTIPVFLVSLKAGGVGLNLTAADTVIHFDPWWNPAVEAQATDRAHRIGQKNVVTSYKLIARGTVEEKILNLQRKKRELIDATIENEEPLMEGLTLEEIQSLLMEG
jgi:superfamily II DNA or RNA helicase